MTSYANDSFLIRGLIIIIIVIIIIIIIINIEIITIFNIKMCYDTGVAGLEAMNNHELMWSFCEVDVQFGFITGKSGGRWYWDEGSTAWRCHCYLGSVCLAPESDDTP